MNSNTRIVVSGYAGDKHRIEMLNPVYVHHQRPLTIVSPADAKIEECCGHEVQFAGQNQYVGALSIDKQVLQMENVLKTCKEEWFLWNDSDSFVLTPELPHYWYDDENTIWSNEIQDMRVPNQMNPDPTIPLVVPFDYHLPYPRIAMQPPWFMHRKVMEKLVEFGPIITDEITPYIDWYYVLGCYKIGIKHKSMRGVSHPTATDEQRLHVLRCVEYGALAIHSVKTQRALDAITRAYSEIKK